MIDYNLKKAPWKIYKNAIQSVVLDEGIDMIGRCAFTEFWKLERVSIPSTVTLINSNPFTDCP